LDAASSGTKRPEFHQYRRAVLLVVGIPCVLLALLITVSVVNDLFLGRPPPSERTAALSPSEMVTCNRDVRALLERIVREASRLEAATLRGDDLGALGASWDAFGNEWQRSWDEVEARCRFAALADKGLGTAYDRTAWVHQSLPRLKLKYREWMARFSRDLAPEIAEMQRALDKSQVDLDERSAGQGKAHE
jgi:hypothetical protein